MEFLRAIKDRSGKTRPTMVYEPGVRGRKTGLRAPTGVPYTAHGTADPALFWKAVEDEEAHHADDARNTTTTTVITTFTTRSARKSLTGSAPRGRPRSIGGPATQSGEPDELPKSSSSSRRKQILGAADEQPSPIAAEQHISEADFEVSLSPGPRRASSSGRAMSRGRPSFPSRVDETIGLPPRRSGSRIGLLAGSSPARLPPSPAPAPASSRQERSPSLGSGQPALSPVRRQRAISVDSLESVEILDDGGPGAPPSPIPPSTPPTPRHAQRSGAPSSALRTPRNPDRSIYQTTPGGTRNKVTTVLERLIGNYLPPDVNSKRERKPRKETYSPSADMLRGTKRVRGGQGGGPRKKVRGPSMEKQIGDAMKSSIKARRALPETEEGAEGREDGDAHVIVWPDGVEALKKVFVPLANVPLRPVANESYRFAKTFSEGEFCAAGSMLIPPGGEKPAKNTRTNAMVFCVLLGRVSVLINRNKFEAVPGDSFFVPRGNQYRIYNESDDEARLFFTHCCESGRRIKEEGEKEGNDDKGMKGRWNESITERGFRGRWIEGSDDNMVVRGRWNEEDDENVVKGKRNADNGGKGKAVERRRKR
ncbi:hypothetical protein HDU93_003812 [Gonapodya sp. JEL0774]|nr:hypothetical protein HDU93_003812 [Gonapodya sp. JEL0774]